MSWLFKGTLRNLCTGGYIIFLLLQCDFFLKKILSECKETGRIQWVGKWQRYIEVILWNVTADWCLSSAWEEWKIIQAAVCRTSSSQIRASTIEPYLFINSKTFSSGFLPLIHFDFHNLSGVSGVGKMIYSLLRQLCLNAKHKRWWQSRYFLMQQCAELRHSKPSLQEVFETKKKQSGIYQSFWNFYITWEFFKNGVTPIRF